MPEEQAPPVVAVVVAADSGPWLEECLVALQHQDYPALSVLVLDAGSTESLAPRVAAVAPGAYFHRFEGRLGFGPAANVAAGLVEGVSHLLFCHDDVVAEEDAVRRLMEEAFRSNAAIVAPKLVDYEDPDRILQLGLGVDRFGAPVRRVERGEIDQSQHDEPREVFAAPGGCTLVRADLFAAIGGFDPEISMFGEDIDLCWRARIAGARVWTAPLALVRHLEATSARRRPLPEARALQWRHELRSVLKNYGRSRRLFVVAELAVLSVGEVAYFLALGRRSRARQVVEAWRWNHAHRHELAGARAEVAAVRVVDDRAVTALFTRRTFRVWRFLRPVLEDTLLRWSARELPSAETGGRHHARGHRAHRPRAVTLVAALAIVVVAFGSRSLVFGSIPLIGRFLPMPSPFHLIGEYLGGFTNAGMQRPGPAPPGLALLGLGGLVTLGGMGLLLKLALGLSVALGALGVARFLRPFGSPVARLAGAVVYLFLPLAWDDLARGDVEALVLYGAAPYILGRLARATGLLHPSRERAGGSVAEEILGFGVLLAFVGAFAPIVLVVTVVATAALAVGSFVAGSSPPGLRAARVTAGACALAVVVLLPWSLTFFQPHAALSILAGALPGSTHVATLGQLLRLDVGPIGNSILDWAFLTGAIFVLFIARARRLDWAVRLWFVGLGTAAFAWVAEEGWTGAGGGDVRAFIAPFGACVAILVGLGAASLEEDLGAQRFGWRHLSAVAFGLVTLAGVLPVLGASAGGRWGMATAGYDTTLSFVDGAGPGSAGERIVFVGEARALPLNSYEVARGLALGVSDGGLPGIESYYSSSSPGVAGGIIDAVRAAESGRIVRLGARLARDGVRYLVVPTALAPMLSGGQAPSPYPPPQLLLDALEAQQDLRELLPEAGTLVFENVAWHPVATPPALARPGGTPAVLRVLGVCGELALVALIAASYLLRRRHRPRRRRHDRERAAPSASPEETAPTAVLALR